MTTVSSDFQRKSYLHIRGMSLSVHTSTVTSENAGQFKLTSQEAIIPEELKVCNSTENEYLFRKQSLLVHNTEVANIPSLDKLQPGVLLATTQLTTKNIYITNYGITVLIVVFICLLNWLVSGMDLFCFTHNYLNPRFLC